MLVQERFNLDAQKTFSKIGKLLIRSAILVSCEIGNITSIKGEKSEQCICAIEKN